MAPPANTTLPPLGSNEATEIDEASNNKNCMSSNITISPAENLIHKMPADGNSNGANTTNAPNFDDNASTATKNRSKYNDGRKLSNSTREDTEAAEADGNNSGADTTNPSAAPRCVEAANKSPEAAAAVGKNSMFAHITGPPACDVNPDQPETGNNNVANTAKVSFSEEVSTATFNKTPSCNDLDPFTPGHVPAAIAGALGPASGAINGGKRARGGKPSATAPDSALDTAPTPGHNEGSRSEGQDAMENNTTAAPDKSNASFEEIAGGSFGFSVENDVEKMKRAMFAITKDSMIVSLINNAKISQQSYLVMRKEKIVSGTLWFTVVGDNSTKPETITAWLNHNRYKFEKGQSVCAEYELADREFSTYPAVITRGEQLIIPRGRKKKRVVEKRGDRFYVGGVEVQQSDCEAECEVKYLDTKEIYDCDVSFIHRPKGWFLDTEYFVDVEADYTNAMIDRVVKLVIQYKTRSFSQFYNIHTDECLADAHDAANKNEEGHVLITGTRGDVALNDDMLRVEIQCGNHFLFDREKNSWTQVPSTSPSEVSVTKKRKAVGDESSKKRRCSSPSSEEATEEVQTAATKRKKAQSKVALVDEVSKRLESIEKELGEIREILLQLR